MKEMFDNAEAFNQSLSGWDVSAVTDMSYMFENTDSFNGDLSTWNTSSCTTMSNMFKEPLPSKVGI